MEDVEQHLVDDDEDVERTLAELFVHDVEVDEDLHQRAPDQRQREDESQDNSFASWQSEHKGSLILIHVWNEAEQVDDVGHVDGDVGGQLHGVADYVWILNKRKLMLHLMKQ